jgi:hypothetical protein
MDHTDWTILACLNYATYHIFWRFTFSNSARSVFFYDLAKVIVGVLFKEFGAVSPARTTACATITIYCYFYHDAIPPKI